jgi:hypothetical protein
MINAFRLRLSHDPQTMARMKEALKRVSLNGTGYVSMTDAISLRNWLIEEYSFPANEFDNISINDLKLLGSEILASN